MKPIIEIDSLTKRFGRLRAVDGLSLAVPEGCVMAYLGPNGAGKTTTIKTLLNMYRPDSGTATVLGRDSRRLRPEDFQHIGYVSENQELPEWMTVEQFIGYCRPMYPRWDDDFCTRLLRQFDLPLKTRLRALSRGMKMKAALLSSLAYRPKLVVLDEPFSGLDPLVRDEFLRGLLELTEEEGWSVFISSHDIDEVERMCDAVAVLDRGRLKLSESVATLQQRFRRIEVTVARPPTDLGALPEAWHHPEIAGRNLCFALSAYRDEEALSGELEQHLDHPNLVACTALSLREIFVALARTYRLEHGTRSVTGEAT